MVCARRLVDHRPTTRDDAVGGFPAAALAKEDIG